MADLQQPPVPPEASMAGNDWFPLHFDRLRKSKWWRRASDVARARNVMLWGEAYKQVPAGSMPDDDDELAEAAGFGMDVEAFLAFKAEIMAPWTMCSDGRWYHPTVCEVVLDAWERAGDRRKKEAAKKADQRAKARGQATNNLNVPDESELVPDETEHVPGDTANVPGDTAENRRDIGTHNRQDSTRPPNPPNGGATSQAFEQAWAAYPIAGKANYGPQEAWREWRPAAERAGGEAALLAATMAHLAFLKSRPTERPKLFHRWLNKGGFIAHLPSIQIASAPVEPRWSGPREIWDAVAAVKGAAWANSWLGDCDWQDVPTRAVISPNGLTTSKLREVNRTLNDLGVYLMERAA